jgi:hypothetical protein
MPKEKLGLNVINSFSPIKGHIRRDSELTVNNSLGTGKGVPLDIASTNDDFKERFKGKTQLIDKEGHMGVVKRSQQPIDKTDNRVNSAYTSAASPEKMNRKIIANPKEVLPATAQQNRMADS